jgi:hypothetical protein
MEKVPYGISKDLRTSMGSHESTKTYLYVVIATGEVEIVVEHTVSQRMPVSDYEKALDLHERLTCGNGRRVYTPEDLAAK